MTSDRASARDGQRLRRFARRGPAPAARDLVRRREAVLGGAYRLFYASPVELARGSGVYLYDPAGEAYLDAYNNVPSVGHSHPHVTEAVTRQLGTLNTHTCWLKNERYRTAADLARDLNRVAGPMAAGGGARHVAKVMRELFADDHPAGLLGRRRERPRADATVGAPLKRPSTFWAGDEDACSSPRARWRRRHRAPASIRASSRRARGACTTQPSRRSRGGARDSPLRADAA